MAPNDDRPAKRRKVLPKGSADSRDLLDVSSEILMVKVGGGEDLDASNPTDDSCNKKEGGQEMVGNPAGGMDQEDVTAAQELMKQPTTAVQSGDKDAGTEPDKHGAVDKESSDDSDSDIGSDPDISEQRDFYVHKSVLCKTSAFFKNVTKPEWTAPTPRPINLPDEDPKIFHLYVQWLYSGSIAVDTLHLRYSDTEVVLYHPLIQSYVLGEKLMDTTYQNAVLQCLIVCVAQQDSFPGGRTVQLAYKRTMKHSPLRKLLVDF